MDERKVTELGKLIEQLTTSGNQVFDQRQLQEFKTLCKDGGDELIQCAFRALMHQLEKKHSQIRYTVLQLIDMLFRRSHCFRLQMCTADNLNELFELSIGINNKKIPPPNMHAKLMKELAVRCLEQWSQSFGRGYPVLHSSYYNLRRVLPDSVFNPISPSNQIRVVVQQTNQMSARVERLLSSFQNLSQRLEPLLSEMITIIGQLCPQNDLFRDETPTCSKHLAGDSHQEYMDRFKKHRILPGNVEITLKPYIEIRLDDQDQSSIARLKDLNRLLSTEYLLEVKQLLKNLTKDAHLFEPQVKQCTNFKNEIMKCISSFSEMKFVEKEDTLLSSTLEKNQGNDEKEETSTDDEEFEAVDELPSTFDSISGLEFGIVLPPEIDETIGESSLQNSSSPIPDELSCRYKMTSGKLCPRKDKVRCPFHGLIIERDAEGLPLDLEMRRKAVEERERRENDWQDPQFLKDLQAQTGIDLAIKKAKKGQKRYPNLVDIKKSGQTARNRLKKKLKI